MAKANTASTKKVAKKVVKKVAKKPGTKSTGSISSLVGQGSGVSKLSPNMQAILQVPWPRDGKGLEKLKITTPAVDSNGKPVQPPDLPDPNLSDAEADALLTRIQDQCLALPAYNAGLGEMLMPEIHGKNDSKKPGRLAITEITQEELEQRHHLTEFWAKQIGSTEPADLVESARAIRTIYIAPPAHLDPPEYFAKVPSPVMMNVVGPLLDWCYARNLPGSAAIPNLRRTIKPLLEQVVDVEERERFLAACEKALNDMKRPVDMTDADRPWVTDPRPDPFVEYCLANGLQANGLLPGTPKLLANPEYVRPAPAKPDYVMTPMEIAVEIHDNAHRHSILGAWEGWYTFAHWVRDCLKMASDGWHQFSAHQRLTVHAGGWWHGVHVAVICDRPSQYKYEKVGTDNAQMHCDDGPCFAFPGNHSCLYYLHGRQVDYRTVMEPESFTIDEINATKDMELRRLRIERWAGRDSNGEWRPGYVKYIQQSGAKLLDSADNPVTGKKEALYYDSKLKLNILVCVCPTGRVYTPLVPRDRKTCATAQMWVSHGLEKYLDHRS